MCGCNKTGTINITRRNPVRGYRELKPHHTQFRTVKSSGLNTNKTSIPLSKEIKSARRNNRKRTKQVQYLRSKSGRRNVRKNFNTLTPAQLKSWTTIHKMAAYAVNDFKKNEFLRYINYLTTNFPCQKCKPHIREFVSAHPPKSYIGKKENDKDIGLSKWSWEFHNAVNQRLGKENISWESYIQKYDLL